MNTTTHHVSATILPLQRPPGTILPDALGRAVLAFLRHGELAHMAQDLLVAACTDLQADGGLIFDIDTEGHPRLLAAISGSWLDGINPDPCQSENWLDGYPLPMFGLPLARGEILHFDRQFSNTIHGDELIPQGVGNLVGIPLEHNDQAIGSVFLFNRTTGFDEQACRCCETMANTIGLAIATARERISRHQAESELRQAQKMEALGQLAAGVAHDFNNMLTVINGYTAMAGQSLEPDHPMREGLDIALEAGKRAADLARQLLAFSRRQMLQPRVLDLDSHLDRLQKLLRRLIREDIRFTTLLAGGLPYIKADPGQLEQVLMNLVINARDAMPEGGELRLETGRRSFDRAFLAANPGSRPGDYVWFRLSDTGSGIAPEDLKRIFQPFFTTKEQGKGTGLGLATVYGIVKQSGGYITVESQIGAGTSFTVYLPATSEGPDREGSGERPVPVAGSGRILLVEDDRDVLHFATRALLSRGFEVCQAADVELAIDLFNADPQAFCILVTDMVMPTLSGPLLAKQLRRQRPDLPALFISGYGQVTFENDFLHGEKGDFLAKPFTGDGLANKILQVLGTSQAGNG
ncbi:MAG: GAF domain-containing sensor histidine kinase [Deltaproteobacteria bacterium]|nr:MAG: GAF domain-containing sensor histidine kinase [Deltaproteobacteria bacterium]